MVNSVVVGLHVTVCAERFTVNATSAVAEEYWAVEAAVARTVHVPIDAKVMTAVDGLIVHPVVPALTNE